MYTILFNAITDTLETLKTATSKTEELYMESPDTIIEISPMEETKEE